LLEILVFLRQKYQTHMDNRKLIVAFYLASTLVIWFLTRSSFQFLSTLFYQIRRLPGILFIREALPVVLGATFFLIIVRHARANAFMEEVVSELKKVTWPSRDDVVRSTIVVLVCICIASLILGSFDVVWGKVIGFLLNS